jgi:hypothetical protein
MVFIHVALVLMAFLSTLLVDVYDVRVVIVRDIFV